MKDGGIRITSEMTMEVEGGERPAMVAETDGRRLRLAGGYGPICFVGASAAGSTYDKYASPAIFGRRLPSGPFSAR